MPVTESHGAPSGEGGGEGGQATARRPAGGLRRSPLSEALGVGEAYSIALLLLAFTEPAATLSPEQGGGPDEDDGLIEVE